jgi:hypothetical protein
MHTTEIYLVAMAIIFANVLLDKQIISADAFTALLVMAVASTMITVPAVTPLLKKMKLGQSVERAGSQAT